MEKLVQRALYGYSEVKISRCNDIMDKSADRNKLFDLLTKMREDSYRCITLEHLDTSTFREFACKLLGDDKRTKNRLNTYLL